MNNPQEHQSTVASIERDGEVVESCVGSLKSLKEDVKR